MSSRTAWHEAGHVVAAHCLGRTPAHTALDGNGGGHARHIAPRVDPAAVAELRPVADLPFTCWPRAIRDDIECSTLILLAGGAAETLARDRGDVARRDAEATVDVPPSDVDTTLPAVTAEEAEAIQRHKPGTSDVERVHQYARIAFGDIESEQHDVWMAHMRMQALDLVVARRSTIRRVADALDTRGQLGADALAKLLGGAT